MAGVEQSDPAMRMDRIRGLDSSGTAFAVVDAVGRFVDIGLDSCWWTALGPERLAAGLLEALSSARMKAALVPLIMRKNGVMRRTGGLAETYQLIKDVNTNKLARAENGPRKRVLDGPRGLFRLHVRGSHIEGADIVGALACDDGDRVAADARDALVEFGRSRWVALDEWGR
ncbi:hypothetical protein HH310_04595 [Actinoplanes sp. TBRC 11911]|uniref:hypothetical protein n=1 Tax=Actinoplanes sp. TBRC 11911 TaxID=2729386 RepID=UPI00145C94A7|nr:hypothetical protein [Actinoplanes sp. TBRC 11911]NMO50471.1 hypothetical protein [Actinoplanes sp. TBRC 11911]